jgi:acid phosphatase (class A)
VLKYFNVSSFKKSKPPSDNSFDTAQEIKALKKIPLKKDYVKKYDNIEAAFKKTAEEQGVEDYDEQLVAKLVKDSVPIILELKKHYNRPRPYELDKSLAHFKMKSMETPSYPSGHSVQGMLIGNVLKMKYGKSAFMQTAKNISYSRRVARAHYKSDSKMGEKLGNSMFNFIKDKI